MIRLAAQKGRRIVRASITPLTVSRFAVAVAAIWMYGAGAAWAGGGGGESLTTLQNIVNGLCNDFSISPCPQLPTVTQAVLEVAGLENSPPEMVRALNNIAPGSRIDSGNAAAVPPTPFPLTANTSPTLSDFLSTLTPLAFISSTNGKPAAPAQLYNPNANTFLYGVASGTTTALTGLTEPTTLDLFYEDLSRNNQAFTNGQIVAKFSLPLTVLNNDGTESAVMTTLEVLATCNGGPSCLQAYAVGGIGTSTMPVAVAKLGINFAVVFSGSPILTKPHAIFEFAVPLLVTAATDPLYFYFAEIGSTGPINFGIPSAFFSDVDGSCPGSSTLGCIGIAPTAAPLGPATAGSATFALCASLPDNSNGPGAHILPAVGAYYAIVTNGETLLSAPLGASSSSVCPTPL
jgi:hypothetical protein